VALLTAKKKAVEHNNTHHTTSPLHTTTQSFTWQNEPHVSLSKLQVVPLYIMLPTLAACVVVLAIIPQNTLLDAQKLPK
jgi:hypothetical protein